MILNNSKRKKKIISIRSKFGRKETHELLLFRSNENIYGYISSLSDGKVLFSVSTLTIRKEGQKKGKDGKIGDARSVGSIIGQRCKKLGIKPAINIAQYKYHGRVSSLVEAFRDASK